TIDIEERGMRGQPLGCAAEALLEHYGIRVPPELVLDQLNAQAAFQSGPYQVYVPYPFWVRTVRQSVETDHPVINSLESMVLPWASPLQLLDNSTSHYSIDILARSTEYSFTQKGVFNISPSQELIPTPEQMKPRIMAVALTGKFKSYFTGKTIPPAVPQPNSIPANDSDRTIITESPETKMIVVGNSRFITGTFPMDHDGNRTFFLNAVDWFTIGDHLINIRSREAGERPIMVTSAKTKTTIRVINIIAIPLLLIVFGLTLYYRRRRRKKRGVVL
ncbi:MAG: hypothetical protein GY868_15000, partial [Deltaproteobacteria bacterium]|nr:hypothetical protein [Deltaproteobacteria bacterium]